MHATSISISDEQIDSRKTLLLNKITIIFLFLLSKRILHYVFSHCRMGFRRTKKQHNNLSNSIELKPRKKKRGKMFITKPGQRRKKITLKTTIKSKSDKNENNCRTINFILFFSVSLSSRTKTRYRYVLTARDGFMLRELNMNEICFDQNFDTEQKRKS